MEKVKSFFKIDGKYKFEWNDLRAVLQLINLLLIVVCGFDVGAVFGLVIGGIGLIKDFAIDRHINGMALHLLGIALNIYILLL